MCVAHLPEGHFLQVYFLRAIPSPGVSSKEKLLTGSPAANPLGLILSLRPHPTSLLMFVTTIQHPLL